MAIPPFQDVMRPMLAVLSDGDEHRFGDVIDSLGGEFGLTDDERAVKIPSGGARLFDNRCGWAMTHMAKAGLVERTRRGYSRITDTGREALAANPMRIDIKVLSGFDDYAEYRRRAKKTEKVDVKVVEDNDNDVEAATPEEIIDSALRENRAAVQDELLSHALNLSPTGFEDLVVNLLENMGYGQAGNVQRTSATGDAGVDGIISQDPLGLDRIYVQAKRYAIDRVVDRPRIHEFAGALLGKQGDRGVFITTARFTSGAIVEAEKINARIELIDGTRLGELMLKYRVGVQAERTIELFRVDGDYFENL